MANGNGKKVDANDNDLFKYDLLIKKIGTQNFVSPLTANKKIYESQMVPEDERVLAYIDKSVVDSITGSQCAVPSFEKAGPREKLFFEPGETVSAIVTCGGICPGLNAVIRGIVVMNYYRYNNQRTFGINYGYAGLVKDLGYEVRHLTPAMVENMQLRGGTMIGTSRGGQDPVKMVDRLVELGVNVLYAIGGDGTQRGAMDIIKEIEKRNLKISVIGIPKTIDNDINYIDRSFGTETAFSEACDSIDSAYTEATSIHNGIGIVKLMGRESGFISANATLATNQVDFCLIPEMDFRMTGDGGFLDLVEKRLRRKKHCVIVVAEGAGQGYVRDPENLERDESGNVRLGDIGVFIKDKIRSYLKTKGVHHSIKYIDPSYIIRSCSPTPNDSIFCSQLAQMAVHAGMTGRTGMVVGYLNGQFIHIPMELATSKRKKIDTNGQLWLSVIEETGQPPVI
ncbi:MAG TPA: ATP-dependent 6-phosphofructokinase [bacterium]|nr:ATP-dependent 6-phosphofructokinase [bacterium]HPS30740.1 ATP-dependent 6-phosphofructokinase [bacterium]